MPDTEGFPFLGDELFYLCVILIKPLLVFSGLVPRNRFVPFNVIRVFLGRLSQERPEVAAGWQFHQGCQGSVLVVSAFFEFSSSS